MTVPHCFRIAALGVVTLLACSQMASADCAGLDGDGDGICDSDDPCTNVAAIEIEVPKLRLRKVDVGGSGRIRFAGTLTVAPSPDIDPIAKGLRLLVTDAIGITTIDVTLPAGEFDPGTRTGWQTNASRRIFRYKDENGVHGGIQKAVVKRRTVDSGELRVTMFGRLGTYPVPVVLPVTATVVIDAPVATTGQCGEGEYDFCFTRNQGRKVICR